MNQELNKKNKNILDELQYSPKDKNYSSSGIPLKTSNGKGSRNKYNINENDTSIRDKNDSRLSYGHTQCKIIKNII